MTKLQQLGTVLDADVLVIGGGISGLSSAIAAKEAHPELEVLAVDRSTIGWAGLATKSGNGWLELTPGEDDPDKFIEYNVRYNGDYMNDQKLLTKYAHTVHDATMKAIEWGVKLSRRKDGSPATIPHPFGMWHGCGAELGIVHSLRDRALKVGVQLLSRVQMTDFLKSGERVAGAVGIGLDDMDFYIIRAKSTILATTGCHFKVCQMFAGYGDGIAMAYRAGAEMRNCEFGTGADVVYKNDGHPIYGGHMSVHNKDGVNISQIYAPKAFEVSHDLILGMDKEVAEGRGPLYCDLSAPDDFRVVMSGEVADEGADAGIVMGMLRLYPDKLAWLGKIGEKAYKYTVPADEKYPEVTAKLAPECCPVRVDENMHTTLPGLWAAGNICYAGSSYFGWVRGDGVGNGVHTGMWAGPNAADDVVNAGDIAVDCAQVEALKNRAFAPYQREGGISPREIMDEFADMMIDSKYILRKTDASMAEALEKIAAWREKLPQLTADDAHMLLKCHEAEAMLDVAEMVFRASRMRTESRGFVWRHHREDYPETNNNDWLKWIIVAKRDGEMKLWTENIPIDEYKYRPGQPGIPMFEGYFDAK